MSLQTDLLHPELGFQDEGHDLMDPDTYAAAAAPFGLAQQLGGFGWRSKAFAELESEKIWTRDWVPIGLLPQIPNQNDLMPFTLGFHGIHVQREADGKYAARLNRHQHGGCRFVPEQCRTGKQTKCTIASCNYTRDSQVIPALNDGMEPPEMYKFVGINPDKLVPIKSEPWGPFVMVNLDPGSGTLASDWPFDQMQDLAAELSGFDQFTHHRWLDFKCNWKSFGAAFIGDVPVKATMSSEGIPTTVQGQNGKYWLFPNLLLSVGDDHFAAVVMQATGMGDTLCRFTLMTREGADPRLKDQWIARLTEIGANAEKDHGKRVNWGTSHAPDTIDKPQEIETSEVAYLIQKYAIERILTQHELHWQAPIMDALMMQRRGSR